MSPHRGIDTPKDRSIFPALEQAQAPTLETAVPVATGGTGDDLPGIAVERALRLWMDAAVYRIYLRKFVLAYSDAASIAERSKRPAAQALAHKLRGSAGNLALDGGASAAAELEQALNEGGDPTDCLAGLRSTMDTALKSIDRYAPPASHSDA